MNYDKDEINMERVINKICNYLSLNKPIMYSTTTNDAIKELCVAKLCEIIGITGKYNYKSDFFDFFASIMGEAICEKLNIPTHVASAELRFFKHEHLNLIEVVRTYLENEYIDEAFLDAFELVDKFKHLIPKIKKV